MSKRSLIIAAIALAFAGGAQAATLTVTNPSDGPAPGPVGSLRRAINDAGSGDTIDFAAGIAAIDLTSGELLIEKSLTISGPGANLLSVRRSATVGTPLFRIFSIRGELNVTLSGLTIANGDWPGGDGGGIYYEGWSFSVRLTITGSTISGNTAFDGGGIYNEGRFGGTVNVTNSTVSANAVSRDGGGINNFEGTVTVTNCTISGNRATGGGGGGICNSEGTVNVTNSTISGNSADLGGGIRNAVGSTLTARNTIVARNAASKSPDVVGALTSQGYNFIDNTSGTTITGTATGNQFNLNPMLGPLQDNGGPTFTHALLSGSPAIEGGDSGGSNTDQRGFARPVDDPSFDNASGGDGSDIGAYEVQADLLPGCNSIDRVVNNNNDSGAGSLRAVIANVCAGSTITFAPNVRGAINLTSGELLINKGLTISGPGAILLTVQRSGAAGTPNFRIFNIARGIATISGLTIANGNTTPGGGGNGGGISNNATLTVTNSVISGNTTSYSQTGGGPGNGGGISNYGTLTLANSGVSGNTASLSNGGGILNSGELTISNSTISGNSATGGVGGGIWNSSGTLTIINSTISGNSVSNFGLGVGGGIFNQVGTVTLTNSTISDNTAEYGGGGIGNNTTDALRVKNTIIALNTSPRGPDVYGALTSENFNLIGDSAGAIIAPLQFSDQIGTADFPIDPLLGPLQDNGGPAQTHALLTGSSAIDKGHSRSFSTDQRGFHRLVDLPDVGNATGGDGGDIGAFELGAAAVSLQILSITSGGNGPVVLQGAGIPYGVHRIQASVDLSFGTFIDIATVTADAAGRFQYQSPVAELTNFYRIAFP